MKKTEKINALMTLAETAKAEATEAKQTAEKKLEEMSRKELAELAKVELKKQTKAQLIELINAKQTAETETETETEAAEETAEATETEAEELYKVVNAEADIKDDIRSRIDELFTKLAEADSTKQINRDYKKAKITVKADNKLIARINVRKTSYYLRTYKDKKETIKKDASFADIKNAIA